MKRSSIENTPLNIFVTLLVVLGLRVAAQAGIADSPVPNLGPGTAVSYSVTGVLELNDPVTLFQCTSTSTSAMQVAVETFDALGGGPTNDAVATQQTLAPGGTVLFETSSTSSSLFNGKMLMTPPNGGRGAARILSTSPKLICTAAIADKVSVTPKYGLTVVAKTKQKGE